MLKGLVFSLQTFTNESFALFIDKFLHGRSGVAKGCELSKTNTSVTISEGYFVIRGRFLQIIGTETRNITTDGFYNLICEIDLSKTNTKTNFLQGEIKLLQNNSSYTELIQQDITNNGNKYQYEFARFKVSGGNITDFEDKRTFIDFDTIYDYIEGEADEVIQQIRQALQNVLNGSAFCLKSNMLKTKVKELKERLDDEDRVNSAIISIGAEMMIYLRKTKLEDWVLKKGYFREKIEMLYVNKVKEIIELLDANSVYKTKLTFWCNQLHWIASSSADPDGDEIDVGDVQEINSLRFESTTYSFLIPKSTTYPDLSLSTIITNLYNSLQ